MAGQPACVAAFERGGRPALMKVASAQGAAMVLIALPAAVGLMLVSDPLARLLIGPALAPRAAAVTPFIALGALFSGLTTHYFNTAYTLARRTRRLFLVNALPAAANLVLVLVLVPRHGLMGAVLATVISYALGLCASILGSRGALALPIPWSSVLKCGLASALMAEVVALTPPEPPLASLTLKISLGVLVYAGAALALDAGGVRAQALGLVRRLRPGPLGRGTLPT
jgi:O-antigen/teichoic acid export membrane protein